MLSKYFPSTLASKCRSHKALEHQATQSKHCLHSIPLTVTNSQSSVKRWGNTDFHGPKRTRFSQKCDSHGTNWNLFEPLRNLYPAWAKHDFSFSEPTGTCSEPTRFWALGLGQTQISQKCILTEPVRTLQEPIYFKGSFIRNHYFPCPPVLQFILLNKSTGDPPKRPPTQPGSSTSTF